MGKIAKGVSLRHNPHAYGRALTGAVLAESPSLSSTPAILQMHLQS
jgi:hypothetical protein